MQTIHLTNYHLGGATPGAESGGTTPTPPPTPLPDAGKPYVEGVTYDPDTKRVRLQARVARAGEVKTPLGEVQEFPIHVPTPPPTPALPDAGKAYADSCTYDHATRTVTVHARNPQAGEVKSPDGETRQFHIEVPDPPKEIKGVVFFYEVYNSFTDRSVEVVTGRAESVTMDEEGTRTCKAYIPNDSGDPGNPPPPIFMSSDIMLFADQNIPLPIFQVSEGVPSVESQYSRLAPNGVLIISRMVTVRPN